VPRETIKIKLSLESRRSRYSHSIAPVEKIEWWTGICPPNLPRGTHVELVLKQIFGISKDIYNILLFYTSRTFISSF